MKINRIIHLIFLVIFPLAITLKGFANSTWHQVTEEIFRSPEKFALKPISGGSSNSNYHLVFDNQDYFVRRAPSTSALLSADIKAEYRILLSLEDLDIAPQPVYFNENRRILVTEFIYKKKDTVVLKDMETCNHILDLLRQVHQSSVHVARIFHPYNTILKLANALIDVGGEMPGVVQREVLPALRQISEVLPAPRSLALCHLDLHSGNILSNGQRYWITDWEQAMMGSPLLDIAAMACVESWDDPQMNELLTCYMQSPTEADFHQLYLYRIAIDVYWALWGLLQTNISRFDAPYEKWAQAHVDAALSRIKSPKYFSSIIALQLREAALEGAVEE